MENRFNQGFEYFNKIASPLAKNRTLLGQEIEGKGCHINVQYVEIYYKFLRCCAKLQVPKLLPTSFKSPLNNNLRQVADIIAR
jgi:hypothetical protein